jgi:hypothetical protein
MKASSKLVVALIATAAVVACRDGLIYSERTSISLASARINDDPATPVAIKLGFDRTVVAVAPPLGGAVREPADATTDGGNSSSPSVTLTEGAAATTGNSPSTSVTSGGEAVSQFSTFSVNVGRPFVGGTAAETDQRQMWVHSRFASGGAALAIAEAPEAVAAVMGLPTTQELAAKKLSELADSDRETLCNLAARDFGSLTKEEKEEAGRLTRYYSLYDSEDHAEFRSACESHS